VLAYSVFSSNGSDDAGPSCGCAPGAEMAQPLKPDNSARPPASTASHFADRMPVFLPHHVACATALICPS
jgi:hypothetical protein